MSGSYFPPYDRDGIDEAAIALQAIGGPIHVGDGLDADVDDPEMFGLDSFTASAVVSAVGRASIQDANGIFHFMVFGLQGQGQVSTLVVEADTLQNARGFIAKEVRNLELMRHLLRQKDAYLADTSAETYPCDLSAFGLGHWTIFAYRDPGQFALYEGSFGFFNAQYNQALSYIDFTLCPTGQEGSEARSWLRAVRIGHNETLLLGNVIDLARSHSGLRLWRRKPDQDKKGRR
ncbi:MAG: hypothetical protein WCS37_03125 [Chloroflexota bacterium]|nr:hypothetical protein [Chloroflexota bacterium]